MRAIIEYQVATYEGMIEVPCEEDEEDHAIEARAERALAQKSGGPLPFGYRRFRLVRKEP